MLQQFKISFQAIIIFLFGILFLHAATATVVGAQGGQHSHEQFQNLESQIQNLSQRVEALESAESTDVPTEPSASSAPTGGYKPGWPGSNDTPEDGEISKEDALALNKRMNQVLNNPHTKPAISSQIESALDSCGVGKNAMWARTKGECFCSGIVVRQYIGRQCSPFL